MRLEQERDPYLQHRPRMTIPISLLTAPHEAQLLSDAEFLRRLKWEQAPAALRAAARSGDPVQFGRAWRDVLRAQAGDQARRASPRELCAAWSCPHDEVDEFAQFVQQLSAARPPQPARARRAAIKPPASWAVRVASLHKRLVDPPHQALRSPLGLLCGLELLLTVSLKLPQKQWWPLWRAVLTAVAQTPLQRQPHQSPEERLLVAGELPWLAGLAFPHVAGAARCSRRGQRLLAKELVARTDSDGTPHAELLPRLPLWLAPLIRTTQWADRSERPLWTRDERRLLNAVVERSVPLCRADGRLALTNGLPLDPLPVLTAAADVFQWTSSSPSYGFLRALRRSPGRGSARRIGRGGVSVMPSNQSDWARFALLRSDWSPQADSVALTHHAQIPQLDVTAAGRALLHGPWDLSLRIGGADVELAAEWSCACWESDPDVDYIELQMCGPKRLRVERVVLLSRRDRFVLLADAVSGAGAAGVELTTTLPLAADIAATCDTETRAVRLQGGGLTARLLPLALPQDRVLSTPHHCAVEDGRLALKYVAGGRGLMAPLIFDWHPERRTKPAVWRTLTVTENAAIVGGDVAAGYRWRLGDAQWLCYRSLKKSEHARAVLGHHTFHETVVARVDAQGDVDPLLNIEA